MARPSLRAKIKLVLVAPKRRAAGGMANNEHPPVADPDPVRLAELTVVELVDVPASLARNRGRPPRPSRSSGRQREAKGREIVVGREADDAIALGVGRHGDPCPGADPGRAESRRARLRIR